MKGPKKCKGQGENKGENKGEGGNEGKGKRNFTPSPGCDGPIVKMQNELEIF